MKKIRSGVPKADLEVIEEDGIKYRKSNKRMLYNSEFHDNHGKNWTKEDLIYMVKMRPGKSWIDISMSLGRTQDACSQKYHTIKSQGRLDYYKKLEY